MFLINLLLALAWGALAGHLTPADFAVGFLLGYLLLWLARGRGRSHPYFLRARRVTRFTLYFLWQLLLANLRVAYHVLAPLERLRPGIVAVPLDVTSDLEITLLANLVTLTPGTLSLDVSSDRQTLYVHAIHMTDADSLRRETKSGFERVVKEVCER